MRARYHSIVGTIWHNSGISVPRRWPVAAMCRLIGEYPRLGFWPVAASSLLVWNNFGTIVPDLFQTQKRLAIDCGQGLFAFA